MAGVVLAVGETFRFEKDGDEVGLDPESHGAASIEGFQVCEVAGVYDGFEVPEIGEQM